MDDQSISEASVDATELLTGQHREVERVWAHLEAAHRHHDQVQRDLAPRLIALLSGHDAVETQFLYPALRQVTGDDMVADQSLEEHTAIRRLLSEADGEDVAGDNAFASLSHAMTRVRQHAQDEERTLFPILREHCSPHQLTELGAHMEAAMRMAPTHPHPHTPNSKLGATVAGAVTGVVDRARDAVRDLTDR